MARVLIYHFLGRANDLSDLMPVERFGYYLNLLQGDGHQVVIWDRANIDSLFSYPEKLKKELEDLEVSTTETSNDYSDLLNQELNSIVAEGFDIVFIYLWRGPGFKFSLDLSKRLKEILGEKIKIFAIGLTVDRLRHLLYRVMPWIDGAIYGLSYRSLQELCNGVSIDKVANAIYKDERGEIKVTEASNCPEVRQLPYPNYSNQVYVGIDGKLPIYPISLSNEACPFACPFCMRPTSYGTEVVVKDISHVVDELEYLCDKYNARLFRILDSTPPYLALTQFAKEIIRRDLNGLSFSAFSRLDVSGGDDFRLLRKAGIKALFFGVETLAPVQQKKIRKEYPFEVIEKRLKASHEAGIFTIVSFIFPLPGETEETMSQTIDGIKKLAPYIDSLLVRPAGVYPGTEWRERPEDFSIYIDEDYDEVVPVYPVKYLVPVRYMKPFPFRYTLMGKPSQEVTFNDIVDVYERFYNMVRYELELNVGIGDYDFIIAELLGLNSTTFFQKLISTFINGDYRFLSDLIDQVKKNLE